MAIPSPAETALLYPQGVYGDIPHKVLKTGNFLVIEVLSPELGHLIIKTAEDITAQQDLGNSVVWNAAVKDRALDSFDLPNMSAGLYPSGDDGKVATPVALIDWVEGHHPIEDELDEFSIETAKIIKELSSLEVNWTRETSWWLNRRRQQKIDAVLEDIGNSVLAGTLDLLLDSAESQHMPAGVTHGDLAPKNMIIQPDKRIALIDPTLGTHQYRPNYAVPRMLDAAYFYHLLRVQYEQPETAETFLEAMGEQFGEDATWHEEFWFCVIERTASMYHNFILNPKNDPTIDPRRQHPANYVATLQTAISMLQDV